MGLSCDDQDHGVTADDFAWDVLPEPQYLRFVSPEVADTGMEVDAERAAPTFEAFLGLAMVPGHPAAVLAAPVAATRVMAPADAQCTTLLAAAGITSESLWP
jgi:hypothetical protein